MRAPARGLVISRAPAHGRFSWERELEVRRAWMRALARMDMVFFSNWVTQEAPGCAQVPFFLTPAALGEIRLPFWPVWYI
jgi:hypothetical protein